MGVGTPGVGIGGTVNLTGGGSNGSNGFSTINDPATAGGNGGYSTITYTRGAAGAPAIGTNITVVVGGGGSNAAWATSPVVTPQPGVNCPFPGKRGRVTVTWS